MNILFVCTGNTCRSPMAAALLQSKQPHLTVKSAGIFANENSAPNAHAVRALQTYDIQLTDTSSQVTERLLHWADLVLTMTTDHVQTLILHYPQCQEKYYTLKEFALNADNKVWTQLQEAYANVERTQTEMIQTYQLTRSQEEVEEIIRNACASDLEKIRKLEAQMVDLNISDPFGGALDVYEATLAELNYYIDESIKKIEKN